MTKIEWTDRVWNPVTGCRKVSPGCAHCYAEGVAQRFWATQYPMVPIPFTGDSIGHPDARPRRFTDVQCHEDRLDLPLSWRKPSRIFVNSMSDLFHEDVPEEFIDDVFAAMALAPQHTFLVLTKRPERMREYLTGVDDNEGGRVEGMRDAMVEGAAQRSHHRRTGENPSMWMAVLLPLPNVHLGVSVEDQERADERIPILLDTPAAVRWISAEPLLGPVEVSPWLVSPDGFVVPDHPSTATGPVHVEDGGVGLDWIVVGGESGHGARPCDVGWIRDIVEQCQAAGVPVFCKQIGARPEYRNHEGIWTLDDVHHPKGGDPAEWPNDIRVRELPHPTQPTTTGEPR